MTSQLVREDREGGVFCAWIRIRYRQRACFLQANGGRRLRALLPKTSRSLFRDSGLFYAA